jgi:hypothetical protein
MIRVAVLVGLCSIFLGGVARAIEDVATNPISYNESAPTDTDVPNWDSGWKQPAVQPQGSTATTGWNYAGSVNGNSAVYLGSGWVLTAAHVGASALTLNGCVYPMVANSVRTFGNADLIIFQVWPCPALPPLTIRSADPRMGSSVVLLGWGHVNGDRVPTWGYNTVSYPPNQSETVTDNGATYTTNDFLMLTQDGSGNNYQVVVGDSGGPDFIYNNATQAWELAGLSEAMLSNGGSAPYGSALIQLDTYLPQINAAMSQIDAPAMPPWALALLAGSLSLAAYLPSKASSKG